MAWLGTWAKRVKLTIDSGDIDAALTDFPVLVYISASSGINSEDISFVFDELTSDGNRKKIAVTKSDGTTELYVEIEKWDDANEKAWLWVKVSGADSIASGANTDLYLYYDSSHADNDAYVGDPSDAVVHNVWDSNFKFVSHMRDDPDTSHIRDSTVNANDGTKKGAGEPAVTPSGIIAGAQDFDGIDDEIDLGADASFEISTNLTMEVWVNTIQSAVDIILLCKENNGASHSYYLSLDLLKPSVYIGGVTTPGWHDCNNAIGSGVNTHIAAVYDGSSLVVYTNGAVNTTFPGLSGSINTNATKKVLLGNRADKSDYEYDGIMDEVRISSSSARSAAWIKATYETSRDHLLDFGSEESALPTIHATYHGNITDTGGENCDFRGFVWDTASHGDPGGVAPGASDYALGDWTEGNSYGVDSFSHQVTGLAESDTFYVRACAHNSAGWSYGSEVSFNILITYERFAAVSIGIISTALRNLVEAREASVDVGIAASAHQFLHYIKASVAVGVSASASRGLALAKIASVAVGIASTAVRIKVIHKSASVAIGVAVSAKKFRIYVRQAAVAIGIRVWEGYQTYTRNAAVAVGVAVSASRTVVHGRSALVAIGVAVSAGRNVARATFAASVAVGIAVSALRLKRVLRVASVEVGVTAFAQTVTIVTKYFRYASVAIGVAVSAARVKVIHQAASVAVGIAVSASRIKGVVRVASVAVGIAVSASRALVILREAAVETGITIASYRKKRVLRKAAVDIGIIATADITAKVLNRLASVSVGIAVSASRNLALATKSASVEVGIAVSATSAKVKIYIASVAIGVAVSASRGLSLAREASVDIGIDVTALRIKVIHIAALVLIGITAAAQTTTIVTKYFRYATVAIGVAASASKSIIVNRYASTAIGVTVSALKIKTVQRFASVAVGIAVSASRSLILGRFASVAVGVTAWATRIWYRRHLVGTLITAQYRNVQMITAQYRLVQVITAMYRKVKLIIS